MNGDRIVFGATAEEVAVVDALAQIASPQDDFNCTCGGPIIEHGGGIEKCQVCGKLAGASVMVPFGAPLPPTRRTRVA